MSEDDDYKVGYGRPPRHSQFRTGQPSANPKGRPKKDKTMDGLFLDVIGEMHTVMVNGKRRRMTTYELIRRKQVNKALGGDMRAITEIVKDAKRLQVEEKGAYPTQIEVTMTYVDAKPTFDVDLPSTAVRRISPGGRVDE